MMLKLSGPESARVCGCQSCQQADSAAITRRGLLSYGVAGGVVAGLLNGATLRAARAQTNLKPDAALEQLLAGNRRFMAGDLQSFHEDLEILKQNNVAKQEPFAALLSCADSRVPVELAFDQSIGHLFVVRVAGNVCTPEIIASLEYGAAVLGTAVIVVLGHSGCGAVKATISAKPVPGQISALYAPIRRAVEVAGEDLQAAIKANAQIQADLLRTASPVVADLTAQGRLKVVSAYYDIGSGAVTLLN
jgi:carbonic anhydrase